MNKVIAAFDFDGTLTTKDTMFDFLEFSFGKPKLIMGLAKAAPFLLLFKLGMWSRQDAKERFLSFFLEGRSVSEVSNLAETYSARIDQLLNQQAVDKLKWHKQQGHTVIIISASLESWLLPWAGRNGVDTVIATRPGIANGTITRHFSTPNCYGPEKVRRLLELFPDRDGYELYAYGDSNGDKELLAFADHAFYRTF